MADKNPEIIDEQHGSDLTGLTLTGGSKSKSRADSLPGGAEGESIAKGTFVILIARIFGLACTFVTMNIVLPRLMPEGHFGNFQVLMSFVIAFETALHYGLPAAVSKFIAEDRDFLGYFLTKGFKLQVWFSMILFGISLIICPIATVYFKSDFTFAMLFVLAMIDIPAYAMYNIRMSVLNGLRRFTKESYTVIWYNGSRTAMTISGVIWAANNNRLDLMIPLALVANLLSSLVGLFWSVQYTKGFSGYREEPGMVKTIIKFITPNIVAMFVYQALLKVDLWSVKGFITSGMDDIQHADEILGSYAFAGLIALIPPLLYHSLYPALFPTISYYLGQNDLRRVRNIITQATKAGFIVLLPISVAMCGTSREIFSILAGSKYPHAWEYLGLLVFSMAAYTLYLSASIIIIASNHPEYPLKNVSVLLLSAFILNWIGMKILPDAGIGFTDAQHRALMGPIIGIVVGLVGTAFFARWIYRQYGVFAKISEIFRICMAVIIPAPILWKLNIPGWQISFLGEKLPDSASGFLKSLITWAGFGVIAEYLIYFALYSILLFLFGAFDPEEKSKILKLFRKFRKKSE